MKFSSLIQKYASLIVSFVKLELMIGLLSGANIIIKNSNIGTISDIDGTYEIVTKQTDTLSISYLGYDTKDVLVANQSSIKTVLGGVVSLGEVEIMAYGSGKRCCVLCCGMVRNISGNNFKSNIITESLYPNPSREGRFKLRLLQDYKKVQIQISNMSGQTVKLINHQNINKNLDINLSEYPTGMYIVNIIADGKRLPAKKAIIGG